MHLVELERGLVRHQRADRLEDRVHRTVAGRLRGDVLALDVEGERGRLRAHGAGDHGQRQHLDAVVRVRDLLVHQRLDILVVDLLLLVGQRLEAHEGVLELVVGQLIAELLQLVHEGMAAGMLAHDQRGLFHADAFRRHDLVGLRVLEHAVLMDAALMREGVTADDRLVVLHRERGRRRHQLGGAREHGGVDAGRVRQHVVARLRSPSRFLPARRCRRARRCR